MVSGDNVNYKNDYGSTSLRWASQNGHTEVARFLIENGANVHCKENYGWTPLHYAIFVLLDNGADLFVKDKDGKTAFDHADNRDVLLTKLMTHPFYRQLKNDIITDVQDRMDFTSAALSGQHNTGTAELESQMNALLDKIIKSEMITLSKELKTKAATLQTMSEICSFFEQHNIPGAHATCH